MADVEVNAIIASAVQISQVPENIHGQRSPKPARGCFQQSEQVARRLAVQDAAKPLMVNNGLCALGEVTQVGQTDAVDASWEAALPTAPHQSSYVEQDGRVVGHSKVAKQSESKERLACVEDWHSPSQQVPSASTHPRCRRS